MFPLIIFQTKTKCIFQMQVKSVFIVWLIHMGRYKDSTSPAALDLKCSVGHILEYIWTLWILKEQALVNNRKHQTNKCCFQDICINNSFDHKLPVRNQVAAQFHRGSVTFPTTSKQNLPQEDQRCTKKVSEAQLIVDDSGITLSDPTGKSCHSDCWYILQGSQNMSDP